MPGVHGAVHVADQMDQHLEREPLLLVRQLAALELPDQRGDGFEYVAVGIPGHRIEGFALVDIQVVPCLGIGVFGRMAGVVEPIGIIDQRMAAQNLVDFLGRLGREVAFGDIGRHIVSFLPPGPQIAHGQQTPGEQ